LRGYLPLAREMTPKASPPVGINPLRVGHAILGLNPRIGRGARSNLSKVFYVAPSGASFGVFSRCMRLSGKAATGVETSVPTSTGRGSGCGVIRDDASAWPVAREVPAGWCTNPTGTLARGMIVWPSAARLSSPPFYPPRHRSSSRQRGRLVCVPLRHVLPIRVSGVGASDPITSAPRPEGDRCSGPGICTCDSARPRRRPRLA